MRHLRCLIGLHSWTYGEEWTPSRTAQIVTRFRLARSCLRCGRLQWLVDESFA